MKKISVISSWMLVRHCVTNEQKILAHGYVSLQCVEKRSFVLPMGTERWRVILKLTEQQSLCHTHSIVQGCTLMLHISCAHVKTCVVSKSSNHQRLRTETYSAIPIQPFTSWAMDLIGPMARSKDGNEWIVTWVDRTSKTIVAVAAAHKHTSAEDLTTLTFKEICCRFGLPQNLTMDNDVLFVSSLWKSLWYICGTKLRFTSSYHPQADPAERANRQVLEALRAAVATVVQYDEWDRALPYVTFGLNNHVSTATRMSLFEFAHGFTARTPLTLGLPDDRPLPVDMKRPNVVRTMTIPKTWPRRSCTDTRRPQIT